MLGVSYKGGRARAWQDIAWSVEQTEGETYTDKDGKATFGGTEYGDDAQYQMEEGSENLLDGDDYDW